MMVRAQRRIDFKPLGPKDVDRARQIRAVGARRRAPAAPRLSALVAGWPSSKA